MVCKWQVEIDPYCQRVLAKHWPDVRRHDDVRTFPPAGDWGVDVICGGFPCQDISYAGGGAGLAGERSGLFYEVVRVVREVGPRFVVLENVAALLTRGLDQVLGTLASVGFDAEWHCIPAASVGAPHIRDRVFIVGARNSADANGRGILLRGQGSPYRKAGRNKSESEERKRIPTDAESMGENVANPVRVQGGERYGADVQRRRTKETQQTGLGSCGELYRNWATEPNVGRVAHGVPKRVDRLRGLGNAVVPQVAEWIGRRLVEATKQDSDTQ